MPTQKTSINRIKNKPLTRTATFNREAIDEEARIAELAFSSEEPVDRAFGIEILDHSPASVRLGRLRDGGPVLVDHDARDHVGVIESVSIDGDRRGRAAIRFGKSARAMEIFQDVIDGIRRSVSVGYRIHDYVQAETNPDGQEVYRVTDWEPFEVSIVSVPADATVGVGRSADQENEIEIETIIQETRTMPDHTTATPAADNQPDVKVIQDQARKAEQDRVRSILTIGEKFNVQDLARQFVDNGQGVDAFREAVLESRGEPKPIVAEAPDLGMSDKDVRRFSIVRALYALANPTDRRAQQAAAFEFESSHAAAAKLGRESRGLTVPIDVLKRDLTVGTATAGGHTVATDLLAGSFIDMLRNRAVLMQAGMGTVLTDLNGNLAIPRQTGGATSYWVAESGAPTESAAAFDQVTMSPKTVGAFSDISRKLLLQSSLDVEAFVRGDLARSLALAIDLAGINGSGASNQPTGILNTTGIGDVAGGTNGLAPTWDHIVDLETEVAIDNADIGNLRYLTNTKVRGKLKKTMVDAGSGERVWDTRSGVTPLNGYGAEVTNQVPSDLTKGTSSGVCSAVIFGNFADLLIGMWGGLDINIDTSTGSTSGTVRVVALQDADIAVRHPESFAAMKDALTS